MPRLGAALNCSGLKVYNIDDTTTDPTAAITRRRLDAVEASLAAAIATQEATLRAAINNLDVKDACVVAATANINLTQAPPVIQGVTILEGDRVLLTAQTDKTKNGIWRYMAGNWERTPDADSNPEVTTGLTVAVRGGDLANQDIWILSTPDPIALGTTELEFHRQRNLRDLSVFGGGLSLSSSYVLSLVGTENQISINPNGGISIASTYAGQTSITTLGTVTTGVWNGSPIPVQYGGTGATTTSQARINLAVPDTFTQVLGDGSTTIFEVLHSLNNSDLPEPSIKELSTGQYIKVDYQEVNANTMRVIFDIPPAQDGVKFILAGVKKP